MTLVVDTCFHCVTHIRGTGLKHLRGTAQFQPTLDTAVEGCVLSVRQIGWLLGSWWFYVSLPWHEVTLWLPQQSTHPQQILSFPSGVLGF